MQPRTIRAALVGLAAALAPFAALAAAAVPGAVAQPPSCRECAPTPDAAVWQRQLIPQQAEPAILFAPPADSLPGVERWRAMLTASGATPLDYALAVRILDDGTTLSVSTSSDLVAFVRLDSSGTRLSSVSVRRPHWTSLLAATVDGAGHVLVLQSTWTGSELAQYDGFDGTERWRRKLAPETTFSSVGQRLALDANGNALVTYTVSGTWHLAQHDGQSGALVWDAALGTDFPIAMALRPKGDVVALLISPAGTRLMRLAADDGRVLWNVDLGPGQGTSLDLDPLGNAFASTPASVVKVGADGTRVWTRSLAGSSDFVAADNQGDVVVHSASGGELRKLSGIDGRNVWGPLATSSAYAMKRDAAGNVLLASSDDLRSYASATGGLLWTRPARPVYGPAPDVRAGRVALLEWADTPPLQQLREVLTASGQATFVELLVATDPTVLPTAVATDPGGNVLVVANMSRDLERDPSVVKYDGATGRVLWGPLTLSRGDSVIVDARGDLVTYTGAWNPPSIPSALAKYAGQDGARLWGPIATPGTIIALREAPDHDILILVSEPVAANTVEWKLSKLDDATGGSQWGPVVLHHEHSLWATLHFDGAGDIVACSPGYPTGQISKFAGASGTPVWGPLDGGFACAIGTSGDAYIVGAQARNVSDQEHGLMQRRRSADGRLLWKKTLPWPGNRVAPLPDVSGRVLLLNSLPAEALRLDVDGRTLWGPVALPAAASTGGFWPSGDVLLTFNSLGPGSCDFSVARLDVNGGGLVWGPLRVGECGGSAALDAHGDVGISSLRDGAWHVSVLRGESGLGLLDRVFADGEWPVDEGGLAFLGRDVVVTGVRGLEGLTARIGVPSLAPKQN